MEINELIINAAPTSDLYLELSDGQRATIASLPDAATLNAHIADTAAHGATSANTASRIVARSATGTATLSGVVIDTAATPTQVAGMLSWNATEETVDVGLSATEGMSIGAELTPRYRNGTGSTLAAGSAVYISGSTGVHSNVSLAQANALLPSRACIGIVTTDAGIANNARGRVCTYGVSHNHNTSGFADGAEVWLSPTVAGGLTATEPTTDGHFKVLIGKVQRSHVTLGEIFVDPHYLGSVTGDGVSSAVSQAAARTALGLGTLATQSGTFSGTSSGTNSGDQIASTVANTPAGGIAATTVQAAINELDTEKANLASPTFTGNPLAPTPATTDNDTSIATTAMVQAVVLSRTISRGDYIQIDGATANRAQIYGPFDSVNNPREWIAGAATLTEAMVIPVPSASSTAEIVGRSSSTTALSSSTAWSMGIAWSDNDLVIRCNGATPATDFRTVTFTGLRTTYSGQTIFAKAAYTNGTTAPVFSVNGVTISGGTAANGGGTTPDWLSASLVPTYRVNGYNWPAGPAPIVTPILGATSAADDAFYMATGKWPAWVVAGASNVAYKSNTFNNESSGWAIQNSATLTNNVGYVTFGGLATNSRTARVQALSSLNANIPVVVSFEYRKTGGSGNIAFSLGDTPSDDTGNDGLNNWSETADTSGSFVSRSFILRNTTGSSYVLFFGGAATYDVRNFSMKNQGALSLPSVQPINVLDDVSGIGGNQGRLLGMTPITDKTTARICADTWTNGNQRILDGTLVDSAKFVISGPITQSTTGTPTTTIGSASAGNQYKTSGALAAGLNPALPATYKLASSEVWVNSDSTTPVRTTIPLQKVQ